MTNESVKTWAEALAEREQKREAAKRVFFDQWLQDMEDAKGDKALINDAEKKLARGTFLLSWKENIQDSIWFTDHKNPSFVDTEDEDALLRLSADDKEIEELHALLTESDRASLFEAAVMIGEALGDPRGFILNAWQIFAEAFANREFDPREPLGFVRWSQCHDACSYPDMFWQLTRRELYEWACTRWPRDWLTRLAPAEQATSVHPKPADTAPVVGTSQKSMFRLIGGLVMLNAELMKDAADNKRHRYRQPPSYKPFSINTLSTNLIQIFEQAGLEARGMNKSNLYRLLAPLLEDNSRMLEEITSELFEGRK